MSGVLIVYVLDSDCINTANTSHRHHGGAIIPAILAAQIFFKVWEIEQLLIPSFPDRNRTRLYPSSQRRF